MPIDVMPTEETKRMTCPNQQKLADYLGGWIDDDQCCAIEQHLETCKSCQAAISHAESAPDSLLDSVKSTTSDRTADQAIEPEVKYAMSIIKRLPVSDDTGPHDDDASSNAFGSDFPGTDRPSGSVERMIGPYLLIRSLGHGGMGSVHLARHCQLKKLVAIKVLPSRWLGSDVHLSRFQREIRAAGGLNHPSIVTATDAGQQGEIYYLVMEYVDGYDLSRVARLCGPLRVADACEAIRHVALGLAHAHSLGIVHRDIKPSNMMLSQTGEVKILDFGLARHSLWDEASAELTTVGQLMGTLDYMAPEQAECAAAVDYRADLYSLGATLFRLLVGRPPLAAAPDLSPLSKLKLLASHDSPCVDTLRDDVPKELANFIALLLHRDLNRRPASAAHVAEKLKTFADGNDLATLALQTKQKQKTNSPGETNDGPPRVAKENVRRSSGGRGRWGIARWRWAVASAGFTALLFAGILLFVDTHKGQLVIESDAEQVTVRLLKDGKQYDTVKIQPGATATKLFAGKYEIEIEGVSDDLLIDRESVIIRKGETVLAKIGRPQNSTNAPQKTTLVDEPVYDGEPLSVWLNRVATERSPQPLFNALQAVKKLVGPGNADHVRNSLISTMATVGDQEIKFGSTNTSFNYEVLEVISASFEDPTNFYDYIVEILKNGDTSLPPHIYPQLIRFEQTHATPLINYLITDVFKTESDPNIVRMAANYTRVYLATNREINSELNEKLAAKFYAHDKVGLDFWLEYPPSTNYFGYAEFIQQKAFEALEFESSPDELLTQAAIILTELDSGTGTVQVSLSDDDKKRAAGLLRILLDRLSERPDEIVKLVEVNRTFSKFSKPRSSSLPFFSHRIVVATASSRQLVNASLALELLELARRVGSDDSTDAAVERILAATIRPALLTVIELHPLAVNVPNTSYAWPDLTVLTRKPDSQSEVSLHTDRNLLAYLIYVAGYYALSDAGKENARQVFIHQFAKMLAKSLVAYFDRDGNEALSKTESSMSESDFQAYDQNGDETLTQDEIRDFIKAKLMAAEAQNQINAASNTIDSNMMIYAKKLVERYDTNKDGVLEFSEWNNMLVDPSPADLDRDDKITVEEYAIFMQKKSGRSK